MQNKEKILILLLPLAIVTLLFLNLFSIEKAIFAVMLVLLLASFVFRPELGVYGMIFSLPFTFISFKLPFQVIGEGVLPLPDLISIFAFLGFVLNCLFFHLFRGAHKKIHWPVFGPFLFFMSAVIISSLFSNEVWKSLWYSLRTIFVIYWFFIFLPYNVLDNFRKFKKAMLSFALSALGLSTLAVYTLSQQNFAKEFVRFRMLNEDSQAIVASFLSRISDKSIIMYPYATEHLLLAEFLLAEFFITLALRNLYHDRTRRFLNMLLIFVFIVLFGTFSRGIWLCLMVIGLIYGFNFLKRNFRKYSLLVLLALMISSPLFYHMYKIQSDYRVGGSSNENRMLSFNVAMNSFVDRPMLGRGSGEFVRVVARDIRYVSKFGKPPDAFGFWQKITVENGLIGMVAFLYFSFYVLRMVWQKMKIEKYKFVLLPISAAALSVYLFELTNVSYYTGKMWLPIGLLLAAINILDKNEKIVKYRESL